MDSNSLDNKLIALFDKWSTMNFLFKGVNWWPLIRTNVNLRYFSEKRNNFEKSSINSTPSGIIKVPNISYRTILSIIKLFLITTKANKTNAIFTYDIHKTTFHNGGKINQYTQPFIDYFKDSNIDFDVYDVNKTWLNPINTGALHAFYRKKTTLQFNNDSAFRFTLKRFTDDLASAIHPNFNLFNSLAQTIISSQANYLAYLWCFKKAKYKNILYYCYYGDAIMAINRAAKKRGIKTIEYQHSQVSKEHIAYSGWKNMHEDLFFPSIVWAWSADDVISLKKEFSFIPDFTAILGGNVFVPWYLKTNNIPSAPPDSSSLKILLTLQGIGIPTYLFDYIAKSENVVWFIREHPRQPFDKALISKLKAINPKWVDIENANKDSLYKLLSEVNYHITSYSGSAIEAQLFNVKNIIFSEKGYKSYQTNIEQNEFLFIRNDKELDIILKKGLSTARPSNTVLIDDDKIKENIKAVFS